MKTSKLMQQMLPQFAGLAMSILFGLSFLFIRVGLDHGLTPLSLPAIRFAVASLVLLLLWRMGVIKLSFRGKPLKELLLLSLFYPLLSALCEMISLQYISVSISGVLVSLNPICVMLLSALVLKEKPTRKQTFFIFVSTAGVATTVLFSGREGASSVWGIGMMLIAVLTSAVQNVLSRKASQYFSSTEITCAMIWIGAIGFNSMAISAGLMQGNLYQSMIQPLFDPKSVWSVCYLAIGASIGGFFSMNFTLSRLKAVNAAVYINLATVVSILVGVGFLREVLHWYQLLGGGLIIIGVLGTNLASGKNKDNVNLHNF